MYHREGREVAGKARIEGPTNQNGRGARVGDPLCLCARAASQQLIRPAAQQLLVLALHFLAPGTVDQVLRGWRCAPPSLSGGDCPGSCL